MSHITELWINRWMVVGRVSDQLDIRQEEIRNQCIIFIVFTSLVPLGPLLDSVCMLDTHTLMSGKQSGMSLMARHTGKVSVAIDKI